MTVNTKKENNRLTVTVSGSIGTPNAAELDSAVKKELDGIQELVFDLKEVDYMASAGLRVLMSSAKSMRAVKGKMKIINAPKPVMEVFDITGALDVLDVKPL